MIYIFLNHFLRAGSLLQFSHELYTLLAGVILRLTHPFVYHSNLQY